MSRIAIIGGGNIGTWLAAACSKAGHETIVFSSYPEKYHGYISVVGDAPHLSYTSAIHKVTDKLEEAVDGCDYVFVTYPVNILSDLCEKLYPLICGSKTVVGFFPGATAEFAFKKLIDKGTDIFGLQRVPGVARLISYGESVRACGIREKLHLASIYEKNADKYSELISEIFSIPCEKLPNYLCLSLVPSNSILHTGRLYSMFGSGTLDYDRNLLFYEEWDDRSSDAVLSMDSELQEICKRISAINLSGVTSLRKHYGVDSSEEMTNKIRSIKGFKGLTSPMKLVDGRYVADTASRYFSADFPYGLGLIKSFADVLSVPAKNIKEVLNWYIRFTGCKEILDVRNYGIDSIQDIYSYYIR